MFHFIGFSFLLFHDKAKRTQQGDLLGPGANSSLLLLVPHPIRHHLTNATMDRQPLFFSSSMVGRQEGNLMERGGERANNVKIEFLSDITGQNTKAISSINAISNLKKGLLLMVQSPDETNQSLLNSFSQQGKCSLDVALQTQYILL